MTNIIETIARAIFPEASKYEPIIGASVKGMALDVIDGLNAAGFAIVPVEPTEAMEEAARDVPLVAMGNGIYLDPAPSDIYRAMIDAGRVR